MTVEEWLNKELLYARGKWSIDAHDALTAGFDPDHWMDSVWVRDINMYLHRAGVLGLDNPLGRQALGKALTTVFMCVESVQRHYGPLPSPGVSSGAL